MTYLIANWKSHHSNTQSLIWLKEIEKHLASPSPDLQIVVCLPFTDIPEFNRHLNLAKTPLLVGAQTVSAYPAGKHTGDITAEMLSELVTHCLVGHSERRLNLNETTQDVAKQSLRLLKHNITPIICLDTPYLDEQIKELFSSNVDLSRCLIAYEPLAAIGSGQPESPQNVEKVTAKISLLTNQDTPILYGGSVSPENISTFTGQPSLAGFLVGTSSLSPATFGQLITLLK